MAGLETVEKVNTHLADKSYIEGYTPSQADVCVHKRLGTPPSKSAYPHAARWYKHISSYNDEEQAHWNGEKSEKSECQAIKVEAHLEAKPADASNDIDLFGEDAPAETAETGEEGTAAEEEAYEATGEEEAAAEEETHEETGEETSAPKDENEIDLFGDNETEEDTAAEEERERRAQEALAKKAASGKVVVGKSMITFDVKPFDDETDLGVMEVNVRSIVLDGLEWKASELVPIAYGIKKLRIKCVVFDDKVSVDDVQELIEAFDEIVQSVDVAAFNKL